MKNHDGVRRGADEVFEKFPGGKGVWILKISHLFLKKKNKKIKIK